MKNKQAIDLCKKCTKRSFDKNVGLVCSLTNKKPDFVDTCIHYQEEISKNVEKEQSNKIIEVPDWRLPLITCVPPPIDKLGKRTIIHADEKELVLKYTGGFHIIFGSIFIISFVGGMILEPEALEFDLILGIIGVLLLTLGFTTPKKQWVFNRLTQMVSVPGKYYVKSHEMKIDEMRIKQRSTGSANTGYTRSFPVVFVPMKGPDKWFGLNWVRLETLGGPTEYDETWSFISWYMDTNRPLPPGEAFDHCRKREFESRKAKGFPLPMYYSIVPTPEANEEFQAIRDKVWKDETFCPDINKYGEGSLEPGANKIPRGSIKYSPKYNPEKWKELKFIDPAHFKYAPEINWLRYVFNDGKIIYVRNILNEVLVPPSGSKYTTEYFRDNYIDMDKFYEKKRYENFKKE